MFYALAVYNITPMQRLRWKTPTQLLNGLKPDVSHLRVFGCGAYVWLPKQLRKNKLQPKAELMTFIGFSGSGNYQFMRSNGQIFEGTTAVFDEELYPRCKDQTKRRAITRVGHKRSTNTNTHPPTPESDDDEDTSSSSRRVTQPQVTPSAAPQYTAPPKYTSHPPPPVDKQDEHAEMDDPFDYHEDEGLENPYSYGYGRHSFVPQIMEPSISIALKDKGKQRAEPPKTPPRKERRLETPDPPSKQELRRSKREKKPRFKDDSVYGKKTATEILKQLRGRKPERSTAEDIAEGIHESRSQSPPPDPPVPGGFSNPEASVGFASHRVDGEHSSGYQDNNTVNPKIFREGGVAAINALIAKAVDKPSESSSNQKPIKEWSYRDILKLPKDQQALWNKACEDEYQSLVDRDVFDLVDRPQGRKTVKCRWVFAQKSDGRKKARLVAKGFSQVEGVDFDEIFSPVVRFETVRLAFALSALMDWHIEGLDVKSAFLYGKLDEEIFMEQPEGYKIVGQEDKVFHLKRSLYGLKQAALSWWKALEGSMKELGFSGIQSDAGLFLHSRDKELYVLVIVYVDDALFIGPNLEYVRTMKNRFMKKWECRDLGKISEYLGMRIQHINNKIYLDQMAYLEKVLERFNLHKDAKTAITPLPSGYVPQENKEPVNPRLRQRFQEVIGSLLYIMLGTRPDISYAVTKLARYSANPSIDHLTKALYICRYLAGTRNYALIYDGKEDHGIEAYTDSDWAADTNDRKSITGFFFKLAGAVISWRSHTQKTIALSSTEAEYMALSDCGKQATWYRSLLGEAGISIGHIPIYGDNQGSIFIASNPVQEKRTKHIDIRFHHIRQLLEEDLIKLFFLPGSDNPADMLTKNLGHIKFHQFRKQLGLEFFN